MAKGNAPESISGLTDHATPILTTGSAMDSRTLKQEGGLRLETLQAISTMVAQKRNVGSVLDSTVSLLVEKLDLALARIWLAKPGDICAVCPQRAGCQDRSRCLHLVASAHQQRNGDSGDEWHKSDGFYSRFPIDVKSKGRIGRIGSTGESQHLIDTADDDEWLARNDWLRKEGVRSFVGHPLIYGDEILGVLAVFSRDALGQQEYAWLRAFADHAAVAIANARAFEEIDQLRQELKDENEYLKEEINEVVLHKFLIGRSPAWAKILQQIDLVGGSDVTVLLTGESGTGKEMVARALHEASPRNDKPLVRVNCAAISAELFESEFFGHVKGAFTGAFKDRVGRFQLADGGTIFLDEMGELPLPMQAKLLRVLQEKQLERVGEDRTRTVDVRIIAATNRNLWAEVEAGNFRQDLYYRLSVFPIHLPPLRDRLEDIEPLVRHFLKESALKMNCEVLKLTEDDIRTLEGYWYPGNVRELQNIVERAIILARCSRLNFTLPQAINHMLVTETERAAAAAPSILTFQELKDLERENIVRTLKQTNYKIYGDNGAAILLGTKPTTLISRIKALEIPMRPEQ